MGGTFRPAAFRVVIGLAALGSALLGGQFVPQHAYAHFGVCYDDPVVALSNLAALDLSDTINIDSSSVQQVTYVLHGPRGTFSLLDIPTSGLMGYKEKFVYYGDQPANTYIDDTYVTTSGGATSVTASMFVTSLPSLGTRYASGYSGQDLHIYMYMPGLLSGIL